MNSSLGLSKLRDIVHSSTRTWSPPSAALGRLAKCSALPEKASWLSHEGWQDHRGWGCRTATASSWPLCTLMCVPSCSETTPGREKEKRRTFKSGQISGTTQLPLIVDLLSQTEEKLVSCLSQMAV